MEADAQLDAQADMVEGMLEAPASAQSSAQPLEDLSEIALYDAADEVIEPGVPPGKA